MILRITYCVVALLLCIVIGLLIEAPKHLIAETEQDQVQIQADARPEEFLLAPKSFKEREQNRSRMTSQQILNEALQRELNSNEGFKQVPMPQIFPATVSHRSRKKTLTMKSLQKKPRRKSGLPPRNSGSLVIESTSTPKVSEQNRQLDQPGLPGEKETQSQPLPTLPKQEVITATQFDTSEGKVVLSAAAKSASAATVPAGFLSSPKPNSDEEGQKSSLSLFKRVLKRLNRRSEPQTEANERSQSSAPRRFIPTNPKPVSQDDTSRRQTGESATQGKIIQAQQNSAISRELEKLYRKDGRQMPQMTTPNPSRVPQGTATNPGFAPSGIAPGRSPGNQQSINTQQKLPIWKRLFSIGRKKQPQQNQQPQYNQPPQFSQQPQYNQLPSSQQLPRIPSSAPNYGTRNKPGVPGLQNPAGSPFGRQIPTNISRTPRPFPGNAIGTGSRNSGQLQSVFPEKRRINGDAPQFDSFSDQFDPFAIPQRITEPKTPPLNTADAPSQQNFDPFNGFRIKRKCKKK